MAQTREIQNRIKSIRDTMKITKAMYMVSSMKVQKAKNKLSETEPYFYGLKKQIADILLHFPEIRHLYFDNRSKDMMETVKKKGFIIVTGDKGMAGAYNLNILKKVRETIADATDYKLFFVGEYGRHALSDLKEHYVDDFHASAYNPSVHRARVMTEYLMDLYDREELDEIHIIYTRMVNTLTEEVVTEQLLPLRTSSFLRASMKAKGDMAKDGDYLIYPSPEMVLGQLTKNYVTGYLYGALTESFASEESARMLAMQTATDNGDEMLNGLSVQYNRMRQAAITQEITEVIGGAKALRRKKKKQRAK
ncbi:MAG: ATP synthase F1 subunit gamma [Lachnospiraceae bacterium]|nr:ATP synthase F1 subunit gamma [Lachnospiraceae bacterium]